VKNTFEASAIDFLELASEQRLSILQILLNQKTTLTELAKELDSTKPHVHRDLQRLEKADMIEKGVDGKYDLTLYGKSVCALIPSILIVSSNKKYFKTHNFGNLPTKFVQRLGALSEGSLITGYSRVVEKWKQIITDSEDYVYGLLAEEPSELIEPILKKASQGISIQSVFSEDTIIPEGRDAAVKKFNLKKLLSEGTIQRKVVDDIQVVVLLNEKEGCIAFPDNHGEPDIGKVFHHNSADFHEWCLDYFRYCWHNSKPLREDKIPKK
jgi:predicted transcriptional regulator